MSDKGQIIVVGVDFEADGDRALATAIELAAASQWSEVHALYVGSNLDMGKPPEGGELSSTNRVVSRTRTVIDKLHKHCETQLENVRSRRPGVEFRRIVTHLRLGKPADEILQLAVDLDADVVVVGTHNRTGLKRVVLGSVAEKVARTAGCPVLVVRPKDHEQLGDVPEIEPPCPDCVKVRKESDGKKMWCKRHSMHHPRAHTYSFQAGGAPVSVRRDEPWGHSV